ncbi:S-layer homology domain-containing protein [Selenomonas bovis]|uniref:S-layer homology domain-containing protein n=1 Tax=Selenomonas bovis TaxID=416586 RepID=UPI00036A11CC|nr:S-layer homology domain-containing protein [Selenomonas bovis]
MKKTLVSALTTAIVVGAASTTFAAANPFSDVPADHWAYDAVAQLAQDGVIEGYGDTTFQGDKNITRYEMAQMVAKAMAKTDVSAADKAMIDKLAAEFADELNNLGVRVSNLERNADMVKWNGKIEYTYTSRRADKTKTDPSDRVNDDKMLFRLEPNAEVNDHWHVNARLDATTYLDTDSGYKDSEKVTLQHIYAQGDYKNFSTQLGKFEFYTPEQGLVFDTKLSGANVTFGSDLKATLYAGRLHYTGYSLVDDQAGNLQGLTLQYDAPAKSKLYGGAAYYHFDDENLKGAFDRVHDDWFKLESYKKNGQTDKANIWTLNAGYRFDGVSALFASYAKNTEADNLDHSWQAIYSYKGAQKENKGTWGAYAAYRYLGDFASWYGTEDAATIGTKGWEVGANWAPFKNIVTSVKYYDGKSIDDNRDTNTLWGRVEVFF